ncbi:hypothetical protein M422DRAFT_194594, partial [Sphaerobolus stellatus SS14]
YPQLSLMAMDYLAIQGSATPVERVWSSAADTNSKKRNRLSPDHLAALQHLKAIYRRQRSRKMSHLEREKQKEERLKLIDMEVWQDDIGDNLELFSAELELDLA